MVLAVVERGLLTEGLSPLHGQVQERHSGRMAVFSKVVVGMDGSAAAEHALRWAAERVLDPKGLHVVHSGSGALELPTGVEVAAVHSRDVPPAQALLAAACELGADALVIGPHGSGLGLGLGSITRQLLRDAPVPVLVVEGGDSQTSPEDRGPIVACVGYDNPASAAAQWAAEWATAYDAPLVLLHTVAYLPVFPLDSGSDVLASYLGTGVSAAWALEELNDMRDELSARYPDLEITTHVDTSSVIKAVTDAGQAAELVVLGKRSSDQFLNSLGTPRLRRLVARARFPVAVVPASFASS